MSFKVYRNDSLHNADWSLGWVSDSILKLEKLMVGAHHNDGKRSSCTQMIADYRLRLKGPVSKNQKLLGELPYG